MVKAKGFKRSRWSKNRENDSLFALKIILKPPSKCRVDPYIFPGRRFTNLSVFPVVLRSSLGSLDDHFDQYKWSTSKPTSLVTHPILGDRTLNFCPGKV